MTQPKAPPIALSHLVVEPPSLWAEATVRLPGRRDALWLDLRSRDLGGLTQKVPGRAWRSGTPPGALYLPPLGADAGAVAGLRSWCSDLGITVVAHLVAGVDEPVSAGSLVAAWDLLNLLLLGSWEDLPSLPPGAAFIWPLLLGLTDSGPAIERGVEELAGVGAGSVLPLLPHLSPRARRALTEACGEDAFGAVFHAGAADGRPLAAACRAHGIDFLPQRQVPVEAADAPRRLELLLAAELGLIADLSTEMGGSEARAQSFYGAARWFETTRYDTRSLLRDGNLDVVPWMTGDIATVVGEMADGAGRSRLLERLADRYTRGAGESG